jgi:hypothetical protein
MNLTIKKHVIEIQFVGRFCSQKKSQNKNNNKKRKEGKEIIGI